MKHQLKIVRKLVSKDNMFTHHLLPPSHPDSFSFLSQVWSGQVRKTGRFCARKQDLGGHGVPASVHFGREQFFSPKRCWIWGQFIQGNSPQDRLWSPKAPVPLTAYLFQWRILSCSLQRSSWPVLPDLTGALITGLQRAWPGLWWSLALFPGVVKGLPWVTPSTILHCCEIILLA